MGAGGATTVAEYKDVRQYGSVEAAKTYRTTKARVESEIKSSGIETASGSDDYEAKYSALSDEVKNYVQTPTQYKAAVSAAQAQTIATNKPLLDNKVKYYQEQMDSKLARYKELKSKAKAKDNLDKANYYANKYDQYKEYYKGVINTLEKNYNTPATFKEILSYAKDVGTAEMRNEKVDQEIPKQTVTRSTITPTIISYTGGKETVVEQSKTIKGSTTVYKADGSIDQIYAPGEDFNAYNPMAGVKGTPLVEVKSDTPQDKRVQTVKLSDQFQTANEISYIRADTPAAEISPRGDSGGYKAGEFMGQGTKMFSIASPDMPTQTEQYIAQEKIKDELAGIEVEERFNPSGVKESSVFNYDYGQGTPTSTFDMVTGEIKYSQPNKVVEEFKLIDTAADRKERKEKLTGMMGNEVEAPTLSDIRSNVDTRGFIGTVLNIGDRPEISGADYAYAIGKKQVENTQIRMQADYDQASRNKSEEIYSKIDVEAHQARINAGENYDKVQAELQSKYDKANKEMATWTKQYEKEWASKEGKDYIESSEKMYFDAQLYGSAKDTQAKVSTYFLRGSAVTTGVSIGTTALGSVAPGVVSALGPVGMVVGAGVAGYNIGKSVAVGEQTYDAAVDVGFTKMESLQRGALGGATELAPFAYTAAGSLAAAVVVGGTLRYVRKPVASYKDVGKYKKTTYKISPKGKESVLSEKGKMIIDGKKVDVIKFPGQTQTKTYVPGRRTITTQNWRQWVGAKPVSTGYPADTTGHTKAVNLWRQYGLSSSQAEEVVKFVRPQVITKSVSGYAYKTDSGLASGTSYTKYKWLDQTLDKKLGIKTDVQPDKLVRTDYTRAQTAPSGDKQVTGFLELSQSRWSQGGTTTYDLPALRIGTASAESVKTTIQGNVVKATSTQSYSAYNKVGGDISAQNSHSFLIKDISAGTNKAGVSGGPVSNKFYYHNQNLFSKPLGALTSGSSTTHTGGAITTTVTPSLTQIAPPTVDLGLTSYQAAMSPKIDTLEPVAILFTPTSIMETPQALAMDAKIESQQEAVPILFDIMMEPETLTKSSSGNATTTRQETITDEITSPITGLLPIDDPERPEKIIPETESGDPGTWVNNLPDRKKRKVVKIGQQVPAYDSYVMVNKRYKKVGDRRPKGAALDRVARIVDNTISAQGKIVDTGKKVKVTKKNKGDGYYSATKNKFRGFKIVGGRSVATPNTLIEKRANRIDTRGESKMMTVAQFQSRDQKALLGLPVRKTKSKKRKVPYRL